MIQTYSLSNLPPEVHSFWEGALATNENLTPFHSYGWLSSWSNAYNALDEAVVIVEYAPTGSPRALLPMLYRNTELRSLPLNAADYTGSVWQDLEMEPFHSIATHLQREARQIPVFLWNVRASDPLVQCLMERHALIHRHETTVLFAEINGFVYHPGRAPGSISLRELAYKRSRLARLGAETRFAKQITDEELLSIIEVHMERWRLKGQGGNFADPHRVDFVRRLLKGSNVPLLFATMWFKEELLAYRFGPFNSKVYYDWNTGFNPAFRQFSPGIVLLEAAFTHLRTASNIQYLDFLRGEELYKLAWASSMSKVHEFAVNP